MDGAREKGGEVPQGAKPYHTCHHYTPLSVDICGPSAELHSRSFSTQPVCGWVAELIRIFNPISSLVELVVGSDMSVIQSTNALKLAVGAYTFVSLNSRPTGLLGPVSRAINKKKKVGGELRLGRSYSRSFPPTHTISPPQERVGHPTGSSGTSRGPYPLETAGSTIFTCCFETAAFFVPR